MKLRQPFSQSLYHAPISRLVGGGTEGDEKMPDNSPNVGDTY